MSDTKLVLNGVHHTARPTWKLRETIEFYRDKLGLPLIHAISARGWGPSNHPDFLHFFFDSGKGSTIAFFYYINTEQPDYTRPVEDYRYEATHTAWAVETRKELLAWRERLEAKGIHVLFQIRHELIESIYFHDPNGYYLEITIQERPMNALDSNDAARTLEAAMAAEDAVLAGTGEFTTIDQVWREKARGIAESAGEAKSGDAAIYVLDVPEFEQLVAGAKNNAKYRVEEPKDGYRHISASEPIILERKVLGLAPAFWNASLTGGFAGEVKTFDRYTLEVAPQEQ